MSSTLQWLGDDQFSVAIVGESFSREEISQIAQNPLGCRALVLCEAKLFHEPKNPHDVNAVAVEVAGRIIGHLPREEAKEYVARINRLGFSTEAIFASAIISGGLNVAGHQYEYSVQLDISPTWTCTSEGEPRYTVPVRLNGEPTLCRISPTEWTARVWIPASRNELCNRLSVDTWTTDKWNTVNFYVLNRQHIGLGFRLLSVPKSQFEAEFGDRDFDAYLQQIEGRVALLYVKLS